MGQSRANKFSQSSLETAIARDDEQKQIRWWQVLNEDRDAVVSSTIIEDKLRKGEVGCFGYFWSNIANEDSAYMLIKIDAIRPHLLFEYSVEGDATFHLYEEPTITDNGVQLSMYNHNRNFPDTALLIPFRDPTASSNGTELSVKYLPGGTKNDPGLLVPLGFEWVLKPNTDYLLRVNNISGGAIDTSITAELFLEDI
jgi:hypothetical protein